MFISAAFRFHTTQANASISASTEKRNKFDPCAPSFLVLMLASTRFHGEISPLMLAQTRLKQIMQKSGHVIYMTSKAGA